jgi:hypothetical protein
MTTSALRAYYSDDPFPHRASKYFPVVGVPAVLSFLSIQAPKSTTMTDMYDGKKGEPFEGKLEPYPHNELGVEVSGSLTLRSLHHLVPCPPLGVSGR